MGQPRDTATITPLTTDQNGQEAMPMLDHWNQQCRMQDMEGTVDHLRSLLEQEKSYAPCMDYLSAIAAASRPSSPTDSTTCVSSLACSGGDRVNEAWRRKLCEWCFEVVDHFGMEREVVSVAMNYLDRIVAKTLQAQGGDYQMAKRQFQLISVSSLYIAVKLHGETDHDEADMDRTRLNVDVFVELSRGFFQAETLEATELSILFNLDWHLNPPTPLKFIASLMRLIPCWTSSEFRGHPSFKTIFKAMFDISMYLTELSVCVSTFTFHSKNSIVAYAAILCAMEALEDALPLPYDVRVRFLNNVAQATGLMPESEKVRCVRNLLMELCPSIEERDVGSLIVMGEPEEDDAGKTSPVCVSYAVPEELVCRKRSRV